MTQGSGKYPLTVGIMLVIANMVGTGVFTSLGYQVGPVPSSAAILLMWAVGGVVSLCGALCYAELATSLRASGGEYLFLSRIFHPGIGFLSGWVSMLVGFAGAVSAVALAIGEYAEVMLAWPAQITALVAIALVTVIHLSGIRVGGLAQNMLTGFKLSLIVFFCAAPLFVDAEIRNPLLLESSDWSVVFSSGWAVSLVFVIYAYSGWNASAYIAGNLENPGRNLPRSLVLGTLVVTGIYLLLNGMFLSVATHAELKNQNDVGNVVAVLLFGETTGRVFSLIFSVALLSTLSAMTIAGPRVGEAMGNDYRMLGFFSELNRYGMPWKAIVLQSGWAMLLVLVSSFKEIIQYISVSLSWFTLLSVVGIFVLRRRQPQMDGAFRIPLFPVPALVFIGVTSGMIVYVTIEDPWIILYSLLTIAAGFGVYLLADRKNQK